jgi:hypothetical protein
MKPQFEHDCEDCKFLGSYDGRDLYFCPGGGPTIIARRSSDPPDYSSGLCFGKTSLKDMTPDRSSWALRVAYLLACDQGLITGPFTEGTAEVAQDTIVGFKLNATEQVNCPSCAMYTLADSGGTWHNISVEEALRMNTPVCDECKRPLVLPSRT